MMPMTIGVKDNAGNNQTQKISPVTTKIWIPVTTDLWNDANNNWTSIIYARRQPDFEDGASDNWILDANDNQTLNINHIGF